MKFVINDKKTGKSYSKEMDQAKASQIAGKRIGEEFDGGIIDLPGYKLKISGGSDKSGFPMRLGVHGQAKKRILVASGVGFHPSLKGQRRRKTVMGDTVGSETAQVNCTVEKQGKQTIEEILGVAKEEKAQ